MLDCPPIEKNRMFQIFKLQMLGLCICTSTLVAQSTIDVQLRSRGKSGDQTVVQQQWKSTETAVIVCDVWDYHHCLNAVRRVEQFAPRLNQVLVAARKRGAIIIHSPSDCMEAYRNHPARLRAMNVPQATDAPTDIDAWCSSIPSEELATYPIDQSDGGEDDDPAEHAQWAKELESLGRNPRSPWKKQTKSLTIHETVDYISDRGDEVWNVLQKHGVKNVILVGVHTNMCVLGRPFGLRQMVRGDKNVVLMRDMTDTMYNPKRWPYVSHFEGTRRIVAHIERYVCPTISSDQLVGGKEFRFPGDRGCSEPEATPANPEREWATLLVPETGETNPAKTHWYRCVVRIPKSWQSKAIALELNVSAPVQAWINGAELSVTNSEEQGQTVMISGEQTEPGDANLIVIRVNRGVLRDAPVLRIGSESQALAGLWQTRIGDDPQFRNMPLPAKFGAGSDIVFTPDTDSKQ